jgi:hypothetical protein
MEGTFMDSLHYRERIARELAARRALRRAKCQLCLVGISPGLLLCNDCGHSVFALRELRALAS